MDGVERRQLTAQRTHGAIMSDIFHCRRPRFTSTAYSASCERVIMIMPQNYFLDFLAVDWPSASFERQQSSTLERDDFSSNRHPALSFCLRMISAQTLGVCREGKPVPTFPDHAPASRTLLTLLSTLQIFSHSAAQVHRLSAHRAQAS
jgi:hypothetical protein